MDALLRSICSRISDKAQFDFCKIELEHPYPFPWKDHDTFFDAMPESVLGITQPVEPLYIDPDKHYDLVILGYQPWFLSPSIPFNSFLHSEWAKVLQHKPVVTVIGCRNMWLRAQEIVKRRLIELGADLAGNIVFDDKHPNLASTKSIVRWMIHGQKEASGKHPEAGVSSKDIGAADRFGPIILEALEKNELPSLQQRLLLEGAIPLRPDLIVMESRGAKQFPTWARKTLALGPPGDPARAGKLKQFKVALFIAIFILSPISGSLAKLKVVLQRKRTAADMAYFQQVQFRKGHI